MMTIKREIEQQAYDLIEKNLPPDTIILTLVIWIDARYTFRYIYESIEGLQVGETDDFGAQILHPHDVRNQIKSDLLAEITAHSSIVMDSLFRPDRDEFIANKIAMAFDSIFIQCGKAYKKLLPDKDDERYFNHMLITKRNISK